MAAVFGAAEGGLWNFPRLKGCAFEARHLGSPQPNLWTYNCVYPHSEGRAARDPSADTQKHADDPYDPSIGAPGSALAYSDGRKARGVGPNILNFKHETFCSKEARREHNAAA